MMTEETLVIILRHQISRICYSYYIYVPNFAWNKIPNNYYCVCHPTMCSMSFNVESIINTPPNEGLPNDE